MHSGLERDCRLGGVQVLEDRPARAPATTAGPRQSQAEPLTFPPSAGPTIEKERSHTHTPAVSVRSRTEYRGPLTCDGVCVQPAAKREHVQLVQPGYLLQELLAVGTQARVQHGLAPAQLEVEDALQSGGPVRGRH